MHELPASQSSTVQTTFCFLKNKLSKMQTNGHVCHDNRGCDKIRQSRVHDESSIRLSTTFENGSSSQAVYQSQPDGSVLLAYNAQFTGHLANPGSVEQKHATATCLPIAAQDAVDICRSLEVDVPCERFNNDDMLLCSGVENDSAQLQTVSTLTTAMNTTLEQHSHVTYSKGTVHSFSNLGC